MKTLLAAAVFLMSFSTAYADDITRKCDGYYRIVSLTSSNVNPVRLGSYKGRGSCGRLVPNKCRSRASAKLIHCMRAHWNTDDVDHRPYECTHDYGVENYSSSNIKYIVNKAACDAHRADDVIHVAVRGITSGKEGCSRKELLAENYVIDCSKVDWRRD